jgi:glycosyltransferase involved in cell wall biosynthesis
MRYFKGRIPVFFRGDSTLLDKFSVSKRFFRKVFLSWVYRNIDFAFYVGTNNRLYFLEHELKENQLIFAPHAIDNDRFFDDSYLLRANEIRLNLGIGKNDIVYLFAGKLEEKKQPIFLINAFVKSGFKQIHLVIVGNGHLEPEVKEIIKGYNNIHLLDFQNQSIMPAIYRIADLFILPSARFETWGLAINEAMASGLAILASDKVGCAVDLVQSEINGYTFESGNTTELQSKFSLLNDKQKLKRFGELSKEIISKWSFLNIAEAIETSFLTIITQKNN